MSDEITASTIRTPRTKDRPYFSMCRATAQDDSLSWEARGVLSYLLSKPDTWKVNVKNLQQKCGRDKIHRILKELRESKYLHLLRERKPDGTFEWIYHVYETPYTDNQEVVVNSPYTDNQEMENQDDIYKREESYPVGVRRTPATQLNPMKDAIALAFGWPAPTKAEWGRIQAAAKQLVDAGVTPLELPDLYRWCKAQGWSSFTPLALAGRVSDWRNSLDGTDDDDLPVNNFDKMLEHLGL